MATKSNCMNIDFNTEENTNPDLQYSLRDHKVKQSILDAVGLKKKELQRNLKTVSTFMEIMIKKHKMVRSQLFENFNDLKNKYQNKKNDLDKNKQYKVCLNVIVTDLYKKYEIFKCHLKEQDGENKYLEEKINKFEKCLNEEKTNIISLKNQNHNHIKCLEQKSEELSEITKKLLEKTDELNKEKKDTRELKSKLDDFIRKVDRLNLEELRQIKNLDILKIEIEIEQNHNKAFNQIVYEQSCQKKELIEVLNKCNKKIDVLQQTIEKEKMESDSNINKLRNEKSNVEKENRDLDKEIKETKERLEKLVHQNENLKTHLNELQCKLDITNKNINEKQKLSMDKIEKIHDDTKRIITDMTLKNQLIIELEEELLGTKKRYKTHAEKAHNLKLKLENLKNQQNLVIMKFEKSPNIDHSNYSNLTSCVNDVKGYVPLDGLKASIRYTDSSDDFEEKNQIFEKLITKCNTFVNYSVQ